MRVQNAGKTHSYASGNVSENTPAAAAAAEPPTRVGARAHRVPANVPGRGRQKAPHLRRLGSRGPRGASEPPGSPRDFRASPRGPSSHHLRPHTCGKRREAERGREGGKHLARGAPDTSGRKWTLNTTKKWVKRGDSAAPTPLGSSPRKGPAAAAPSPSLPRGPDAQPGLSPHPPSPAPSRHGVAQPSRGDWRRERPLGPSGAASLGAPAPHAPALPAPRAPASSLRRPRAPTGPTRAPCANFVCAPGAFVHILGRAGAAGCVPGGPEASPRTGEATAEIPPFSPGAASSAA